MSAVIRAVWGAIWPYLLAAAVAVACYQLGKRDGRTAVSLETSQATATAAVKTLTEFADGTRTLIGSVNKASERLAQQINARQEADEQSTEAIRDTLKKTAANRVNCVFDADVMRQLAAARERAATAATAGLTGASGGAVRTAGDGGE